MKKPTDFPIPEKPRQPHPLEAQIRDSLAARVTPPTEEITIEPSTSPEDILARARAAEAALEALLAKTQGGDGVEVAGTPEGRQR